MTKTMRGSRALARSGVGLLLAAIPITMVSVPALAAREWKQLAVPGAVCGDGKPYEIFLSQGDPRKLMFLMMGGGACWNAATCYFLPDTYIHPIPGVIESGGIVSSDPAKSPVASHTIVYFPYCTGDVHLGQHRASYLPGRTLHHEGATNFSLSLRRALDSGRFDLAQAEQFVMMGYSAGALGALLHVGEVEPLVRHIPDKVMIADAPGLHFGPEFWDKFTPELLADFDVAMGKVGMSARKGQGNLAQVIPRTCARLHDWRVGVLQGSRDLVMSRVFGAISQDEHEALIYGASGLFSLTADPADNCSAWVPRSALHPFMMSDSAAATQASTGESGVDYIRGIVEAKWGVRSAGPNHR